MGALTILAWVSAEIRMASRGLLKKLLGSEFGGVSIAGQPTSLTHPKVSVHSVPYDDDFIDLAVPICPVAKKKMKNKKKKIFRQLYLTDRLATVLL